MTTTQFIARHTEAGGTMLRMREENDCACIFLDGTRCIVHSERPIACRLYPLARWVDPDGRESFGHLTPAPMSEGVYGAGGTIGDFLDKQDAAVFFDIDESYGEVYQRTVDRLESLDPKEVERRTSRRLEVDETAPGLNLP